MFKTMARIHSLGGELREVEVIKKNSNSDIVVIFNNIKCTAIFNPFTSCYYVDDVYGVL